MEKWVLLMMLVSLFACKNERRVEAEKIVSEWVGKEIRFPGDVPCYVSGKDTLPELCKEGFGKEFKILLYVDSAGCSSCRLKLFEWGQLMEEADSLFQGKVGFLLFFQPKSVKEMTYLFLRNRFDYPVFMDISGTINDLNRFPQAMSYQCFLLDKDNKVLMIGNPVLNHRIWELYKEQLSGKTSAKNENTTTVEPDKTLHNFGNIPLGTKNQTVFILKNTGKHPLVVQHIATSCGCTAVEWEKQPVEPGKTTGIKVEMRPEEPGYFRKTIDVYCNVEKSVMKLIISGNAIK